MVAGTLTAESADEQARSGLTQCSPDQFARLHALNDAYDRRFGWPFILAVRGPTGRGLTRAEIIETFERRLRAEPEAEFQECLRNVHRIAEIRLCDRFAQAR
jgi:N-carbamoyl-L-amino-acid hydrolase